jgi:hypothetical protein
VVDYCLVPYECLNHFNNFKVTRAADLVQTAVGEDTIERQTSTARPLAVVVGCSVKIGYF